MRLAGVTFVSCCAAALAGAGCSRHQSPVAAPAPVSASAPVSAPNSNPGTFDRPKLGVRLGWPAGWVERPSNDYVLLLLAAGAGGGGDGGEAPSISLDVPDLPPHIPGMIPVGSVRGGYLDDLRKSVGPIKTRDERAPAVANAAARMVRSAWTDSRGRAWQERALLLVHADRVYILRARSTAADEAATRAAFDDIVRSLKWTK